MILDEKFKEFMLHHIIIFKHKMRNLDEKLTSLIERMINKSDSYIDDNTKDMMIDYSNLDCLLPMTDESTLHYIEEQFSEDKKYNTELVSSQLYLKFKQIIENY